MTFGFLVRGVQKNNVTYRASAGPSLFTLPRMSEELTFSSQKKKHKTKVCAFLPTHSFRPDTFLLRHHPPVSWKQSNLEHTVDHLAESNRLEPGAQKKIPTLKCSNHHVQSHDSQFMYIVSYMASRTTT